MACWECKELRTDAEMLTRAFRLVFRPFPESCWLGRRGRWRSSPHHSRSVVREFDLI